MAQDQAAGRWRRALRYLPLASCLLAVGCGSPSLAARPGSTTAPALAVGPHATGTAPSDGGGAGAPDGATTQPGGASPPGHRVSKILVIMEENHSIGQVFPAGMPYLWSLAVRYGRATAWSDVGHPSLPNYLAIFGGSAFGDPQDCSPGPGCSYRGPSVFGQVLAKGESARAYEESMPSPCAQGYTGNYDVNHNPWAYFPSERRLCQADDVPAGSVASGPLVTDVRDGTLPTVGLITPNLIHDGHDGTLAQADGWLRSWIPVLMSGPDWRSGRLAIVVVFDEGETTEQVPFVLVAPWLSGVTIGAPLNQYSLTRLLEEVAGVPLLRAAASARDISPLFGLGV